MLDLINNFTNIQTDIRGVFGCDNDFFINPMLDSDWIIQENDETFFLSFIDEKENAKTCVISRQNGVPLIFEREEVTMVVAIECVKIAFIFLNKNKQ